MRTLLIGRTGQVAWELQRSLGVLGDLVAVDRAQLDLADSDAVKRLIRSACPAVIVNAAAYTNVDGAEDDVATAFAINAHAPETMAREARTIGATLIHYSTDYVFDGSKADAYVEDDPTAPLNAYGRSKLAGEQAIRASGAAHLILRTSWVYASRGRNFLRTIMRLAAERPELRVVNDQHGAPTAARFIAQATALMIRAYQTDAAARERVRAGATVHLSSAGETTWYGFAQQARGLAIEMGLPFGAQIVPIGSDEYPTKARRPRNSRLNLDRLQREWGIVAQPWQSGLRLVMEELALAARASG
jgi:dTDP-4-dehydrorhamnose reductase